MSERPDADAINREAIAQAVLKFKWKASESTLKEHAFNEEYRSMRWFANDEVRRDFEEAQHQLFCRPCLSTDKTHNVRAPRLYIAIEKDQLGNVPAVCHLLCYNCGWEVYVNPPRDPRNVAESDMAESLRYMMDRQKQIQRAQGMAKAVDSNPLSPVSGYHQLRAAAERGLIDPQRYEELVKRMIEGAARQNAVMPQYALSKKPPGFP